MALDDETPSPTWWDHNQLNYWLWACLHNARAYLDASNAMRSAIRDRQHDKFHNNQRLHDLNKYHFILTVGSLARQLDKVAALFPTIQPLYEKAEHFRKEGLLLRNMIEHAITNFDAAAKGTPRGGFTRKAPGVATGIPGSGPGISDASGVLIDDNGHWLGGRLNVERVIAELHPIYEAAQAIPPPRDKGPLVF